MEADLIAVERDHIVDVVSDRRRETLPIPTAVLHGIIAPALLTSPLFATALDGDLAALIPLAIGVIGGATGLVFGWLDAPGRLAVALATREDLLALMLMAIFSGMFLGLLWGGSAGALLALLVAAFWGFSGTNPAAQVAAMMLAGSFLGGVMAAPGVTYLSLARALIVRRGAPWWLAPIAGVLGSVGSIVMIIVLYTVLFGIVGGISRLM